MTYTVLEKRVSWCCDICAATQHTMDDLFPPRGWCETTSDSGGVLSLTYCGECLSHLLAYIDNRRGELRGRSKKDDVRDVQLLDTGGQPAETSSGSGGTDRLDGEG